MELRISGVAVTHYSIRTSHGDVVESKTPALAVMVEVRLRDPKKDRALLGWTYGIVRYGALSGVRDAVY